MTIHEKRFPNETEEYRQAREELLAFEIDLRERIEKLGRMRMALPLGGQLAEDYVFDEMGAQGAESTTQVKLSELFAPGKDGGDGKDTLLVYSFMYGPQAEHPCPACTSLLDGFNGIAQHVLDRINMAVVAKSPIARINDFAQSRGWNKLRLLSSANNSYNADYHGQNDAGDQIPAVNVFTRNERGIFHFFNAELLYAPLSGHPRHADLLWPIWNILDMTPEGRGEDWSPRLNY